MIQPHTVELALETLRPGLASDGFDLRVGSVVDNDVRVVLEAKPNACLDCLVPDEMIVSLVDDLIRKEDGSLGRVVLVKEGFDAIAH